MTLQVKGLSKTRGNQTVLDGLDLELQKGERFVLLGPSGTGKSTLLHCLAGLDLEHQGDILLDGKSIRKLPAHMRNIGLVFQKPLLFPHLTVEQNVAFGLRLQKLPGSEVDDRVQQMLTQVGMHGHQHQRPAELSGGEASRVSLARTLVLNPQMLLLDEPFSQLDAGLRQDMQVLVKSLLEAQGQTTLMVTHDQQEAFLFADRLGLLMDGKLMQVGKPEEVYLHPATPRVARFFGVSNWLSGHQRGHEVYTDLFEVKVVHRHHGPVRVGFRASDLTLEPIWGGVTVEGVLKHRAFAGSRWQGKLEVCGHTVDWEWPLNTHFAPGDGIRLHLPTEKILVYPDPV